ncbi:LOW QUALITY PROTEIN: hypothetical protein BC937DRAFT_93048 [Endogone sp. FLAS-F59071]|nr:LOW QUALITY PROTEIN: hypothetical protein BC937DRAFT_93048 [Endogone sp. FLAS-F59071]|eukprot:RUS21318.1 LOW QUALITY PROTEIN: hypothetical protein BC937DRAFT_93048 [Endogone sp. FLAS-F59071]
MYELLNKYLKSQEVLDHYSQKHSDLYTKFNMVFINDKLKNLSNITLKDLKDESDKFCSKLLHYQNLDYVFVILSNHHKPKGVEFPYNINSILVHRENFKSYYRYTFAGHTEFSASTHLHINSVPTFQLSYIPGVGDIIAGAIDKE